jgi:hypothetical protein
MSNGPKLLELILFPLRSPQSQQMQSAIESPSVQAKVGCIKVQIPFAEEYMIENVPRTHQLNPS